MGIIFSGELKPMKQRTEAVKRENKILEFIDKAFIFKSIVILTIYNSLIHPHLQCCVQFWSPLLRKMTDRMERVQS